MRTLFLSIIATLAVACGGSSDGAPAADESKTPAEVKVQAAEMDEPALEKVVAKYETEVEDITKQVEGMKEQLAKKLEEAASSGLDGLLGKDGASDDIKAEAEKLKAQLADLEAHWKDLTAKLNIYIEELSSRAAG